MIGLAIAANRENDGHLSPWQEAVGHEIIPDTHKNGCASEATSDLTLGLFVMLQIVVLLVDQIFESRSARLILDLQFAHCHQSNNANRDRYPNIPSQQAQLRN